MLIDKMNNNFIFTQTDKEAIACLKAYSKE